VVLNRPLKLSGFVDTRQAKPESLTGLASLGDIVYRRQASVYFLRHVSFYRHG
jgi:hypothetical protein